MATATSDSVDAINVEDIVNSPDFISAVQAATEAEHKLGLFQAIRRYPTAALWAIAISFTIVMEGYDTGLLTSFFALPQFNKKYGYYYAPEKEYILAVSWQLALINTGNVGSLLGVSINGFVTEKFGHRRVIMGGLALMTGLIFIPFYAQSLPVLLTGGILLGIPWGIFAIMGGAYASEVCPLALRGSFTSFISVCWVVGQLICAGVVQAVDGWENDWSFRIPFAVQWVWVIPLFLVALFAPDSPAWLIRKGRLADAEKSIRRLSPGLTPQDVRFRLAMLVHTDRLEKAMKTESNFMDCFRFTNLRRTEIACMVLASQSLCGSLFAYGGTYFYVQDGLTIFDAYKLNTAGKAVGMIATFFGMSVLINAVGRRKTLICGLTAMCIVLLIIGSLSFSAARHHLPSIWAQAVLTLILMGIFAFAITPTSFALEAEISATRLRSQTLTIARFLYSIVAVCDGVINSWSINPAKFNLKGKAAFIWAGICCLPIIWAAFRLPETRDRTYEELDILFQKGIPAWKFRTTDIDLIMDSDRIFDEKEVTHEEREVV